MNIETRKVLWVTHAADYGGAELFLRDVLSRRFNGHYLSGIAFLQTGPIIAEIERQGHQIYVLDGGARALQLEKSSSLWAVLKASIDVLFLIFNLKKVMKDYDIVVANSQKALFIGGLAATLARKPFLWVLHDLVTSDNFSKTMRRAIALVSKHLCSAVIVNSQAAQDALIESCGHPKEISVIYNGFEFKDEPLEASPDSDRRALLGSFGLKDVPTVGLFGRITFWKGQHILLDALQKTPGVQALIVGDAVYGSKEYTDKLRKTVAEGGLSDRVRFIGHRDDVMRLIRTVDIVVHSSILPEPFGRVIVEGMSQKRPVVATLGGGVPEIIDDGVNGLLVAPGNVDALSQAINSLLSKPELAQALAEAGYNKVRSKFDIGMTVKDFIRLLDAH